MHIFEDERINNLLALIKNTIKGTKLENKVFVTGGAIRNALLKLPIKDLDLVVNKEKGGIILGSLLAIRNQCFVEGKNPVVFSGYNTAKLQLFRNEEFKDIQIECVETKKSKTEFGTLAEDAQKRDLTINSLMYNVTSNTLFDFNETTEYDFSNHLLRTPNNPSIILKEDPFKILRIIRFSTQFEWDIEKNTWLAMIENSHLIDEIPKEKIRDELTKILLSKKPSIGFKKMYYCGILNKIIQDVYDITTIIEVKNPLITTFDHTMNVLDAVSPTIQNRLAALFHDIGKVFYMNTKDASNIDKFSADIAEINLKVLKYPNKVIDSVKKAITYHRFFNGYSDNAIPSNKKIRKFMSLVDDDLATTINLMQANNVHNAKTKKLFQVINILNRIEKLEDEDKDKETKLPINGNDIIKEFKIKPSPIIGTLLEKVKDAYLDNPKLTKEEAFEIVESNLNK